MGEEFDFLAALERIAKVIGVHSPHYYLNHISIMMELKENVEYNSSLKGFIYLRQVKIVHNSTVIDTFLSQTYV